MGTLYPRPTRRPRIGPKALATRTAVATAVALALLAVLALPAGADPPSRVAAMWKADGGVMQLYPADYDSWALQVSDNNQVIGFWLDATTTPDQAWHRAFIWSKGVATDLGTLGGYITYPNDLNAHGQVVGHSTTSGNTGQRPYLWTDGVMTPLADARGSAAAVNNRTEVVGGLGDWDFGGGRAFHWYRGVMTMLAPETEPSWANDINQRGQIVGRMTFGRPYDEAHAVIWFRGKVTDLGTLGTGEFSEAYYVNDRGQVAGVSTDDLTDDYIIGQKAVLWDKGRAIDLVGANGTGRSQPRALNEHGDVIGLFEAAPGDWNGFLWSDGVFTDLGPDASPWDLNNAGVVAGGTGTAASYHATTWRDGVATTLPDAAGGGSSWAFGVNARGSVVGYLGF